jgi:hypothetical protein
MGDHENIAVWSIVGYPVFIFVNLWKVPSSLSMSQDNMQQLLLFSYTFVHIFVNIFIIILSTVVTHTLYETSHLLGENINAIRADACRFRRPQPQKTLPVWQSLSHTF